jgi:hypothetical protein
MKLHNVLALDDCVGQGIAARILLANGTRHTHVGSLVVKVEVITQILLLLCVLALLLHVLGCEVEVGHLKARDVVAGAYHLVTLPSNEMALGHQASGLRPQEHAKAVAEASRLLCQLLPVPFSCLAGVIVVDWEWIEGR